MSYHSLEDRLTKQAFAEHTRTDAPPDLPVVPEEHQPTLRLLTRGAEKASDEEVARNPRARSVRLRAAERVRPGRPRHTTNHPHPRGPEGTGRR
jgi:16S rRNA (cytosine1402-N4)-methyltransferase